MRTPDELINSALDEGKAARAYKWLMKIIGSSSDKFHLESSFVLISLYKDRFGHNEFLDELLAEYYAVQVKIFP